MPVDRIIAAMSAFNHSIGAQTCVHPGNVRSREQPSCAMNNCIVVCTDCPSSLVVFCSSACLVVPTLQLIVGSSRHRRPSSRTSTVQARTVARRVTPRSAQVRNGPTRSIINLSKAQAWGSIVRWQCSPVLRAVVSGWLLACRRLAVRFHLIPNSSLSQYCHAWSPSSPACCFPVS